MLCFRNFLSAPGVCTFLDMNLHPGMRDHGMVVLTRKSSELAAQPILLERSLFSADNKTDNLELGLSLLKWVWPCVTRFTSLAQ